MIEKITYDEEMCALCAVVNGSVITLTFESEQPDSFMWHYIFKAMAEEAATQLNNMQVE